ncbi:uncharacterized protein LOC119564116 [Chelonia mydas]|uniref:uncharacterized protein LOC119564116 n=1 Tax=Chelonia mydas TaxID=8469 RepID=UPI0018A1C177|nr:uncharacterized protein LOC119564116 [Chelonia mydas]
MRSPFTTPSLIHSPDVPSLSWLWGAGIAPMAHCSSLHHGSLGAHGSCQVGNTLDIPVMLSLFFSTESERERLMRASQSLLGSLQGCILATRPLLCILTQHLDTSVPLDPVGGDVSVGENLERLLRAAQEMHATAEQMDRHVQKNTSRDLYAHMASPHTSLQEKGAIVRDFHQATLGIFGSVGGPVVAVLLRNAGLPERLEAALREAEASPVLRLPMDALRRSSEEIARAVSACVAPGGPAGETAAGPPENGPFSGTGVMQSGRLPARCPHGAPC